MPNNILSTDLYFDEEAHLKKLDDIFLESVTDKLSEVMGLKFFDEKTKIRRNSTYEVSSGLTGVKYIPENADYPEAGGEEPVSISLTKYKYGADVIVTEECKLFDEYDKIEDRIRSITDDALDKLDTCLAEVWLRGFSTDNYTNVLGKSVSPIGQEARALFNVVDGNIIEYNGNPHPTLANGSVSAIRVQGAKHKNSLGQSKPIKYDYLVVGPALEDKARRILESTQLSLNNDINPNKGKMKPVVWDRLGNGYKLQNGTEVPTDNYWFVFQKNKLKFQLKFEWAIQPRMDRPQVITKTSNDCHKFKMLFSYGFLNHPYIAGSKGEYLVEDEPVIVKDATV